MKTKIIKGSEEFLDGIAEIFDCYRVFYKAQSDILNSKRFMRERLQKGDSVIFIALSDQKSIVGFTQLYPSFSSVSMKRVWVLNDLFVVPECRKMGIGGAIMEAALEFARSDGATRVSLSTAKDNQARQLYEQMGFQESSFKFYNYSM